MSDGQFLGETRRALVGFSARRGVMRSPALTAATNPRVQCAPGRDDAGLSRYSGGSRFGMPSLIG